MTMSAINVIANQEHAAMMILEFLGFQKVFFFDLELSVAIMDLNQSGACSVAGATKDVVIFHDWGRDIGGRVCNPIVKP